MLNSAILDVDELAAKPLNVVSPSPSDVQLQSQSFAERQGSNAFLY